MSDLFVQDLFWRHSGQMITYFTARPDDHWSVFTVVDVSNAHGISEMCNCGYFNNHMLAWGLG